MTPEQRSTNNWLTKVWASLELMRPANIVTAFADILAGFAAAGGVTLYLTQGSETLLPEGLASLLIATFGLYAGGVVLNDVFDAELDAHERPERAIPSGRISRSFAAFLGALLLGGGTVFAFLVNITAGFLALAVAICVLIYDMFAKHSVIWGPLFMGLCRGGNLLLGASVFPAMLTVLWPLALLPILYIGAITLVSQGEVQGGNRSSGYLATGIILMITVALILLGPLTGLSFQLGSALPFIALFAFRVLPPFYRAAREPIPDTIRIAVKRGVLSLIILNSAVAAGFAGFLTGLVILLLLPISLLLANLFDVT